MKRLHTTLRTCTMYSQYFSGKTCQRLPEGISADRAPHCPDDPQQDAATPLLTEADVLHGLARLIQGQMLAVSLSGYVAPAIPDNPSPSDSPAATEKQADPDLDTVIAGGNSSDRELG